jgi:COMPASS component SPP1
VKDQLETTWLDMCRLEGCSKPARLPSKYCSDAHGVEFMKRNLSKGRRKENYTDNFGDDDSGYDGEDQNDKDYEDEEESRGGVLKPGELKALVNSVKTAKEFRMLGQGVLPRTRPVTRALNGTSSSINLALSDKTITFTAAELDALNKIRTKRSELQEQRARLAFKDNFLKLVRLRAKSVLEAKKTKDKSVKDICGYDGRLTWDDAEWDDFRNSETGIKCVADNQLVPPPLRTAADEDGDVDMDKNEEEEEEDTDEATRGVCLKKNCRRHGKEWPRIFHDSVRGDKEQLREDEEMLDEQENEVLQLAKIREMEEKEA